MKSWFISFLVFALPLRSVVQTNDLLDPPIRAVCEAVFGYPGDRPLEKSKLEKVLADWLEGRDSLSEIERLIRIDLERHPESAPFVELGYFSKSSSEVPSLILEVRNSRLQEEQTQVAIFVFKSEKNGGVRGHISLLFFPPGTDERESNLSCSGEGTDVVSPSIHDF